MTKTPATSGHIPNTVYLVHPHLPDPLRLLHPDLHARPSLPTIWNPPARPSESPAPTGPSLACRSPGATSPLRTPGTDLGLLRLAAALAVLLLREVAVFAVRHLPQLQRKTAASAHRRTRSVTPGLSFPASSSGEENAKRTSGSLVQAIANPSSSAYGS